MTSELRFGIAILVTLVGGNGCGTAPAPEISAANRVEAQCPPSQSPYFEIGSLTTNAVTDASLRTQYAELLRGVSAPPLWCGQEPAEAYRLLWLPTYGPALMIIAGRTDREWALLGVKYVKKDPAQLAGWVPKRRTEKRVSIEAVTPVFEALGRGEFWTTSFFEKGGEDGELWTLEGRVDSRYRAVTRWSNQDVELTEAARTLVQLSGLELPQRLRTRR